VAINIIIITAIAVHAQDAAACQKVQDTTSFKACIAAKEQEGRKSGESQNCAVARSQFECIGSAGQAAVHTCRGCKRDDDDDDVYWR
jgi:hypothetical protein